MEMHVVKTNWIINITVQLSKYKKELLQKVPQTLSNINTIIHLTFGRAQTRFFVQQWFNCNFFQVFEAKYKGLFFDETLYSLFFRHASEWCLSLGNCNYNLNDFFV